MRCGSRRRDPSWRRLRYVTKPLMESASQLTLTLSTGIERSPRRYATWSPILRFRDKYPDSGPITISKSLYVVMIYYSYKLYYIIVPDCTSTLDHPTSARSLSMFTVFGVVLGQWMFKRISITRALWAMVWKVMTPVSFVVGQDNKAPFFRVFCRTTSSFSHAFPTPSKVDDGATSSSSSPAMARGSAMDQRVEVGWSLGDQPLSLSRNLLIRTQVIQHDSWLNKISNSIIMIINIIIIINHNNQG